MNRALKEALATLETLATFGGTLQQAKELAQKGVFKTKELASQEGEIVITWNSARTEILAVTRQDEDYRILKVIAEKP